MGGRGQRDLDIKLKHTNRLKQALYQSIKQHGGEQGEMFLTITWDSDSASNLT